MKRTRAGRMRITRKLLKMVKVWAEETEGKRKARQ